MKIKAITVIYSPIDIVPQIHGLESCLANFGFTDRLRYGTMQLLSKSHIKVPVKFKTDLSDNPGNHEIRIHLETACENSEDLFEKACEEHTLSRKIAELVESSYAQWVQQAVELAEFKLAFMPNEWFDLFDSIPKSKHLAALTILLARPGTDMTAQDHLKWQESRLESLLIEKGGECDTEYED
jgi:hypothetical protein